MLSNALKFTDEGSIKILARPFRDGGNLFIKVSVSDTGIGISKDD